MQLALLSAVTYWIANRVASRLQALMGKVCCYVSAWRCGHLRAACNGLRMWCFRLCCRLCFARAAPSRHAHLATSRHLPPPNYYQRRRRARTAPQASPARTPAIARAKILKSSPLLGSFLGRIFTSWRPGFSHFHKARHSRRCCLQTSGHSGGATIDLLLETSPAGKSCGPQACRWSAAWHRARSQLQPWALRAWRVWRTASTGEAARRSFQHRGT